LFPQKYGPGPTIANLGASKEPFSLSLTADTHADPNPLDTAAPLPERRLFDLAWILFVASIPLSKALGSLAEALMACCWLASLGRSGQAAQFWKSWKKHPVLWGFPALYLMYMIGGLYSENRAETLWELNQKHYFLTLPLMLGTRTPSAKVMRQALLGFGVANLLVAGMIVEIVATGQPWMLGTPEIPSPLVQRPRASLFIALALLGLLNDSMNRFRAGERGALGWWIRGLAWTLLLAGLVLLKGRVGQVGLLVGLAWMAWKAYTVVKHRVWALSLLALLSLLAWNTLESVRQPFLEAIHEIQESQQGYPHSEPEFSSMGMRFTYWKTYLDLWIQHPWWGVGTGDMVPMGRQLFENHPLEIPYHRPHQQWLELGVQLGLPGVGLLAWAWWLLWKHRPLRDRSWVEAVHLIFAGSMFLDCTLSTQAGISAFMALLLTLHFQGRGPAVGKWEDQSSAAHSKDQSSAAHSKA